MKLSALTYALKINRSNTPFMQLRVNLDGVS